MNTLSRKSAKSQILQSLRSTGFSSKRSTCDTENEKRKSTVTEKDFDQLYMKIEKLLSKIDEEEEMKSRQSFAEECVVCFAATATIRTHPCSHTVVCRKCFIKTIQLAVSERCLPLRCVICRTRILKLQHISHQKLRSSSKHNIFRSPFSRFRRDKVHIGPN